MIQDTRPLGQRLKEDNWEIHERAENDVLPRHMVQGTIPKQTYAALLGQLWLAMRVLDRALESKRDEVPVIHNLVTEEQMLSPYLAADLEHWGVDMSSLEPMPGTAGLIREIERCRDEAPIRLFGLHYVREGANNGNKYVALKLRRAWGMEGSSEGFRYLDPFGDRQRPMWEAFKKELDEQKLTEAEKGEIVSAARSMFEHIMAIHKDFDLPPVEAKPGVGAYGR